MPCAYRSIEFDETGTKYASAESNTRTVHVDESPLVAKADVAGRLATDESGPAIYLHGVVLYCVLVVACRISFHIIPAHKEGKEETA